MKTFVIIDLWNMLSRARYANGGDAWSGLGLCLHITFHSIKQAVEKYKADNVIFATEGRSWRKDVDNLYKLNRSAKKSAMTPREQENDTMFNEAFVDFEEYLQTKTNCCVLKHPQCEADDLIAYWIDQHPDDNHIIISTDSDFQQLLAHNVKIYDGVNEKTYTIDGVYDRKNVPIYSKKTNEPIVPYPEYILFLKIIRGDTSDNIFSAYPGVRETKIKECFADRNDKGFAWNNFMMTKWKDHNGDEHLVGDKFKHNQMLIDLKMQPEHIKQAMKTLIQSCYDNKKEIAALGIHFIKFCAKYELTSLQNSPNNIVAYLKKGI